MATQSFHLGSCKKITGNLFTCVCRYCCLLHGNTTLKHHIYKPEYSKAAWSLWTSVEHQVQHKTGVMRSSFEGPTHEREFCWLSAPVLLFEGTIIPGMHRLKQLHGLSNKTTRLQLSSQLFLGREICSFQICWVQWTPLCFSSSRGKVLAWRK